ncbi:hypothetical protein ARAM_005344 [Aspergillus rambellii]|uniref:Amino acid permease/ SLC12A domain-containing protein n=2 Tax=Aspergillus subgen. Nidulantes TaxID=2720870 RepID=A0A0F8UQ41_9EURO|nr:hypothetical protein AOCH_005664 [Aspergillus ochraceoroseus]KKK21704.1 hypothetical protein ARAM_005344 [Aspergillus rambellii]
MTIGPTLGTGLFIGTGQALAAGGPASLLLSYVFISLLVYCLTTALAEIATHVPDRNGTLITHTYRYATSHLGFSAGYLRWYTLAMLIPFEITTAMVNLGLWHPGAKIALRMGIVMSVIFGFNMLPERMFMRSQTFFTGLKLLTTIVLIMVSFCLSIRGIPSPPARGFDYWRNPGAMNEFLFKGALGRFLGLLECLLCSTISFIFIPELTVQRVEKFESERGTDHPGPRVLQQARISNIILFVLYTLSTLATTLVSPYNDPLLTNNGTGAGFSPYLVGIKNAKIRALPVIATSLIFISSVASGRSFLYMASRLLYSLAETGHAPAILMVRNRWGAPYIAISVSAGFSYFAFLSMAISSSAMYNYLMFFITTSGYISWMCSSVVYLRFRQAASLPGSRPMHRSFLQPVGTYFSLVASALMVVANLLHFVFRSRPQFNPRNAIPAFIGVILFLLMYFGHQIQHTIHPKPVNLEAPDVGDDREMAVNHVPAEGTELQPARSEGEGEGPTARSLNSGSS